VPMVETWSSVPFILGEGLRRLADGRVVMVDILAGCLYEVDPGQCGAERLLHRLDVPLGAVAPLGEESWIAAAGTGIAVLGPSGLEWIDRPEDGAATAMRMNDGVCDPAGRFWAGSMPYDGTMGAGSLYRLDADGSVTQVIDGITIPNGSAFSADGTLMYLADSDAGTIDVFDVDPGSGSLSSRRRFADLDDGSPDGMLVDDEAHLWSAVRGGSRIERRSPMGDLVLRIDLPARQPTSLTMSDGHLFVTSALDGLADAGPADGHLLRLATSLTCTPAVSAALDH